jgi:myo-inositol 2-dehydrogenase / D-chiro-inositol 1-dehydrogenase
MKATRRRLFSILPLAGTAANSAVSVGLIGCGNRGTYLGQLLTEHTTARLAAMCDLYPEQVEKAAKKIGRSGYAEFRDLDKLLASGVDAVLLATPVFLHPPHFEAAVASGKHVYLEKPAAPDVAGCQRIEKAAQSARPDREMAMGFQRRYGATYLKAAAFKPQIGAIRMASVRFIKSDSTRDRPPLPKPKTMDEKVKNWFAWRELSGDLIVENNVHVIDVMNWFVGARPESATGTGGRTVIRFGDLHDHGTVSYQYPSGVQGDMCGMILSPSIHRDVREEFFGERGWLETSENGWRWRLSRTESGGEPEKRDVAVESIKAFIQRIETGQVTNHVARGVESTLTAILGRLAIDLRRPVTWDEMIRLNGWPA